MNSCDGRWSLPAFRSTHRSSAGIPRGNGPRRSWIPLLACVVLAIAIAGCGKKSSTTPKLSPGRLEVTPASLDFGSVVMGQSATRTLTVRNAGDMPIDATPQFAGSSASCFTLTPSAPLSIAGGASVTLQVRFAPNRTGACPGTLNLDASGPAISLSAVGEIGFTVYGTRWETVTDGNQNSCRESARLVWDADVVGSTTATASIKARIYRAPAGTTNWSLLYTTACYTITGNSGTDTYGVTIGGYARSSYSFKIEVVRCDGTEPVAVRGPGDDQNLSSVCFERLCDTSPTYSIFDAWWVNVVDADHDGRWESADLAWDADVTNGPCTKSVNVSVYWRHPGESTWNLLSGSPCYDITSNGTGDYYYSRGIRLTNPGSACFEWLLVLRACGGTANLAVRNYQTDGDLANTCFER